MDPVSLTAMSMTMSAVGGGMDAYGKYQAGQSKGAMYNYQAGIAGMNKKIQQQNAEWALRSGAQERVTSGMKTAQVVGRQRAAFAAGNLDVNFGSPRDVQTSQREVGLRDQGTITERAGRRAYGHLVEAENERAKSVAYREAAHSAKKAGTLEAIGSLIGTAGSVSSKWLQASQMGIGGGSETVGSDPWAGLREYDV